MKKAKQVNEEELKKLKQANEKLTDENERLTQMNNVTVQPITGDATMQDVDPRIQQIQGQQLEIFNQKLEIAKLKNTIQERDQKYQMLESKHDLSMAKKDADKVIIEHEKKYLENNYNQEKTEFQNQVKKVQAENQNLRAELSNRVEFGQIQIPPDLESLVPMFKKLDSALLKAFSGQLEVGVGLKKAISDRDDGVLQSVEKVSMALGRKVGSLTNDIRSLKAKLPQPDENVISGKCQLFPDVFDTIGEPLDTERYICYDHSDLHRDLVNHITEYGIGFTEFPASVCPYHFQVLSRFKQVEIVGYVFKKSENRYSVMLRRLLV